MAQATLMDSDEFFWLVFHPDGRLYFTTIADDIERIGARNHGGPIIKVRRPTIEALRQLDFLGGVKAVELGTRDAALDEIEKLIGAVEGRLFAAIGSTDSEDEKRRYGTKVAFAMELRAAIHALKAGT